VHSGSKLDTRKKGSHSLTIVATSKDGQTTKMKLVYSVVPPENHASKPRFVHTGHHFVAVLRVPAPGTVHILLTKRDRLVVGSGYAAAERRGTVRVVIGLTPAGRRLFAHHHNLTLRAWVTYGPFGGVARTTRYFGVRLRR
jgi:hypothetical protein